MFTEDANDFMDLDEFAVNIVYTEPDYVNTHESSKSVNVLGIFTQEYVEYNGAAGLMSTFRTFKQGNRGGRITYTDDITGATSDYYIRDVQNDGSNFYRWILEAI